MPQAGERSTDRRSRPCSEQRPGAQVPRLGDRGSRPPSQQRTYRARVPEPVEEEIGSSPDRLDTFARRLSTHVPQRFGRTSVLAVALIAVACGVLVGRLTVSPDPTATASQTDPVSTTAGSDDQVESAVGDLGRGLLTVGDLAAIGEVATGGTYTRGSASAVPDPCTSVFPGDAGVSYVPGPIGATSVSFSLTGATLTERITVLADEAVATRRLRDLASRTGDCPAPAGTTIEFGSIAAGLGDEYLPISVVRNYATGTSRTVTIVLVRVAATLVEFALTTPTERSDLADLRCRRIAIAGIAR